MNLPSFNYLTLSTLIGCLALAIPYQSHSYCDPDADNETFCSDFDEITSFKLGNFFKDDFDASACDGVGEAFGDYTNEVIELQRGNTYYGVMEFAGGDNSAALWLDYDQDSSFSSGDLLWKSDEAVFNENNPAVFEITIPSNAELGETRMRTSRLLFDPIDSSNTCATPPANFFEGQYQDYTVDIVESTPTAYSHDSSYVFTASDELAVQGEKAEIIGLNVQVLGNDVPELDLEEVFLNTHSTSHDSILEEAEILYTGGSAEFDPNATSFGTETNPEDDYTITGNETLKSGNNFFWVVYDIEDQVGQGHEISAEIDSFVINGDPYFPDPTSTPETRNVIQPMEGTYTVGSSADADFETINDAVDSLEDNMIGGPVHMEIEPGTYNEEVSIGSIEGISAQDTVVFDGLNKDSVTVTTDEEETFSIFGDYITLQNMTIETTNDEQFTPAIRIWNQDYVNILHNEITKPYNDNQNHFIIRAEGNHLRIGHNNFVDGGMAVQFEEGSYQQFFHNHVDNTGDGGVYYAFNEDNYHPRVYGNEIYPDPNESGRGIYLREVYGDFKVEDNIIVAPHDGIYVYEHSSDVEERSVIANNFIVSGLNSTSGLRGSIRMNEAEDIDIVFNSFNALNPRAINSRDENVYGIKLFNNSFNSTEYDIYFDEYMALDSSNHNNFNGEIFAGSFYSDLDDWQSNSVFDPDSREGNPGYKGQEDLRFETDQLYQGGRDFGGITEDIFGNERPQNTPSIGAFELPAYDLEVVSIENPDTNLSCGLLEEPVEIKIENRGGEPVTDFDVTAILSGDHQDTLMTTYTDSLYGFGNQTTTKVGDFNSNAGNYFEITAYHSLDDDQNRENDTISAVREFETTPEIPVTYNDTSCGDPGVVELVASSPESEIVWYGVEEGGVEIHRGDTFVTEELTSSATYYAIAEHNESGCLSLDGRQSVYAISQPLPEANISPESDLVGTINDGTSSNPDIGCAEELLQYHIEAPDFLDMDGYGDEWIINDWEVSDESGNPADSVAYSEPEAGEDGRIDFAPSAHETGQTFEIYIEAENLETGCQGTASRFIEITASPEAEFEVAENICFGEEIVVENLTTITDDQNLDYTLRFGDGETYQTSDFEAVNHTYEETGTYQVTLEVDSENGCHSSYQQTVTVNEAVEADFETEEEERCAEQAFNFENHSDAGDEPSYEWNFGDGNSSTDENPEHAFEESGEYEVTLVATSEEGCRDTASKSLNVEPAPQEPVFNTDLHCVGEAVNFSTERDYASFDWEFGDGNSSEQAQPEHTYDEANTYEVELTVTNAEGCENHSSSEIEIAPLPDSDFDFEMTGMEVAFTPAAEDLDSYNWDFGDNQTSDEEAPVHTYDEEGFFEVTLETTSEEGCQSTSTQEIEVFSSNLLSGNDGENSLNIYPNPSSGEFTVELTQENSGDVEISLIDGMGNEIQVIASEFKGSGNHEFSADINASELPAGSYFVQIQTADDIIVKPVSFIR